ESNTENDGRDSKNDFPVIAIGATSESFTTVVNFASSIPNNSGAAYIVITPHTTNPEKLLKELKSTELAIPVLKLTNEYKIQPNEFYIIPNMQFVTMADGVIHLAPPPEGNVLKMPIDHFMRSLADHKKENSIAVIFGGNGTDGTLGIQNIHEVGGVSIVQDPEETNDNGMLRSAISTGCVDYILPASKIQEQLLSYIRTVPLITKKENAGVENNYDYFQKILQLLRTQTGNDFSYYKKSTIFRRIEKRMSLHEQSSYSQYYNYLKDHPEEIHQLFKDLLISVTNFFRDPEAFETLKNKVFPQILDNKPDNYMVRVWVPACATGEEVYSIAMLLQEYKEEHNENFKFQIFGTDINEESIQKARMGVFVDNIEMDVSPERLKKFFVKVNNSYVIKKDIRECAIFATQNITKDAPFTKLDILSCRNLLIYFGSELQERLLPVFHYSLKSDGLLFLGSSESVGKFTDAFRFIDKKWKVFQKIGAYSSNFIFNSNIALRINETTLRSNAAEIKRTRETGLAELVQRTLMSRFTPPSIMINEKGDILYVHGHTSKYLEIASGQANFNILNMAKDGLQYELQSAIHEAIINKKEVVRSGLQVSESGNIHQVKITVKPVDGNESTPMVLLVVFYDLEPPKAVEEANKKKDKKKYSGKAEELSQELQHTRENLQATIEELQASNEELQSANEELQSTNEELQSTNEEMETSKEELQSVNEELITLNAELQSKIEQLSRAEDDMRNLLNSTNIGTIFLDSKMRIKRFTSEAVKIINLISTDIGRPIEHIVTKLKYDGLIKDIQDVLNTLTYLEKEVQTKDGNWFLLRIMPYRTVENIIDGVVLTFTEITFLKTASEKLDQLNYAVKAEKEYADSIIHIVHQPIIVLNSNLLAIAVNDSFCMQFGLKKSQALNKSIFELGKGQFNSPEFRKMLEQLDDAAQFEDFPIKVNLEGNIEKLLNVNAKKIQREGIQSYMILICVDQAESKNIQ
ncbi:MAG: CheR family methyltransferase, partial [Clostridiales bacterium]